VERSNDDGDRVQEAERVRVVTGNTKVRNEWQNMAATERGGAEPDAGTTAHITTVQKRLGDSVG
jgi:hypothetical protein